MSWNAWMAAARTSGVLWSGRMCAMGRKPTPCSLRSSRNAAASVPATVTACVWSRSCTNAGRFTEWSSSRCTSCERLPCGRAPCCSFCCGCCSIVVPWDTDHLVGEIAEGQRSKSQTASDVTHLPGGGHVLGKLDDHVLAGPASLGVRQLELDELRTAFDGRVGDGV